jgi:hypothetical protein
VAGLFRERSGYSGSSLLIFVKFLEKMYNLKDTSLLLPVTSAIIQLGTIP